MLPVKNRVERRNGGILSLKGRKRVRRQRCNHGVELGFEEERYGVSGGVPPGTPDSMRRRHEVMGSPEL
tara:strand:- start:2051 stop:2257 length:207 start_codon:yes stop_codon:yes gene_type:complete